MRAHIFTDRSLQQILANATNSWLESPIIDGCTDWGVSIENQGEHIFYIHRKDQEDSYKIIAFEQEEDYPGEPEWLNRMMLARIHQAATAALKTPLKLPFSWNGYHYSNLFAFFASPRSRGSLRWIAQVAPQGSEDVVFWQLTKPGKLLALEDFDPDYKTYWDIYECWDNAFKTAQERLSKTSEKPQVSIADTVALDETFSTVSGRDNYTSWMDRTTVQQKSFIQSITNGSVKLKGAAGTGKTLCLQLKALYELYQGRVRGERIRILFLTHSWAMAEQVDYNFRKLDESGQIDDITVFPLLTLAQFLLPSSQLPAGLRPLGEDSHSGKEEQLVRVRAVLNMAIDSDWIAFRAGCDESFVSRVESAQDSEERRSFEWDLIVEFACVLSAEGILPGFNAEREYLSLQRSSWMMPLTREREKKFVLHLYSKYVKQLQVDGLISSDQLVNDFLKDLSTFKWDFRRKVEGYDVIFVDELHLFNEQERLTFHSLSRDTQKYSKMFMALDPRQSPAEVYAGVPSDRITRGDSGRADQSLGTIRSIDLTTVHRFTPQILDLLRHINYSYPALDLGDDWQLELDEVDSSASQGEIPRIFCHQSRAEESEYVANSYSKADDKDPTTRIAVVVLDSERFQEYISSFEIVNPRKTKIEVLDSLDDVVNLRYTRRTLVLAPVEHVSGLQFDHVVVTGFPSATTTTYQGHRVRRLLSLLYLGISRSSKRIEIHVNDEAGGMPEVLGTAIAAGVLQSDE